MDGSAFGSNTREDRIRARRERIEKRKLAKASDGQPRGGDGELGSEGVSEGKKQTNASLAHIDRVKATSIEEVTKTPPPIIAPIFLVLLVAKNGQTLELLPMLAGFAINQLATLAQIVYPDGWGVAADES